MTSTMRNRNSVSTIKRRREDNGSNTTPINTCDYDDFSMDILNYRIHKKMVGKGEYSTIWEATSSEDPERRYAAKISPKKKNMMVNDHYYNSVDHIYMVHDHPNIIKLHHHTETNQHFYLFIDYHRPPTVTLTEYLQTHTPLSLDIAFSIFTQLVSAICHMHRNGIAHRDIKPDNILIHPETLLVTIIDFGFAIRSNISCVDRIGSPLYMSPEVLNCKSYDPRSADIWSLGIIFYQLIFGSHPIGSGKSLSEFSSAYNYESITIPKNYPVWGLQETKEVDRIVRDLLEQLLQKEQEKRTSFDTLEKKMNEKDVIALFQKKQH
jgi:serine/threonine protein kinase